MSQDVFKPITSEQRLSLIGVFLAIFLAALDQTIVATALPNIVVELHGTNLYAWVATSYLLASTVALPIFGRLAEIMARKWVLLVAVAIFLVGSALSGASTSMIALISFRALQGIGSGGIFAVGVTVLGLMFPPRQRGRIQGLFGAVFGIANVLGPWLGGLLTDHLSWHWIFYVNMPFGLVALYFIAVHMPRLQPETRHRFDYFGALAIAVMTVPLLLALSWGGSAYAWTSPTIIGLFALAVGGVVAFIVAEQRNPEPLFVLNLFQGATFRWAMVGSFFFGAAFLGALLFLPFYLVQVQGISATDSGLSLTPLTLGVVVGSFVTGQLASRLGRYKGLLIVGLIWLTASLYVFHLLLTLHTPLWQIWLVMVLIGLGMGPGMPTYTLAVQNAVPVNRLGQASSGAQFFRQIGSALGAALMGAVLVSTMQVDVPKYLPASMHAAKSQFATSQASGAGASSIGSTVHTTFAKTERQINAALSGNAKAYGAVQQNKDIPASYKAKIPKGGVPAEVRKGFSETQALIAQAMQGSAAAQAAVQANSEVPAQVKALVAHPPQNPAVRASVLQQIDQGLKAAEPKAIAKALFQAQSAVRTQMRTLERQITHDLVRGFNEGITQAVRTIFLYAAILALLALMFAFLLPNEELSHQHQPSDHEPAAQPTTGD
ncbi:MAG: MDR family MFS transporter [Thermaerobacter sp.]|nr:MDR family MFS transporter [Thermaerobacter sp.]